MSWIKDVEVGDKVRYLGGDPNYCDNLSKVESYKVEDIYEVIEDGRNVIINDDDNDRWSISKSSENVHCFELTKERSILDFNEFPTEEMEDMLVSLSQEVAQLKRKVEELSETVDSNSKDIEVIDKEVTEKAFQVDSFDKPVRKVVYEYAR